MFSCLSWLSFDRPGESKTYFQSLNYLVWKIFRAACVKMVKFQLEIAFEIGMRIENYCVFSHVRSQTPPRSHHIFPLPFPCPCALAAPVRSAGLKAQPPSYHLVNVVEECQLALREDQYFIEKHHFCLQAPGCLQGHPIQQPLGRSGGSWLALHLLALCAR